MNKQTHSFLSRVSKRFLRTVADERIEGLNEPMQKTLGDEEINLSLINPNFKSELEYEGYKAIEDYDNDTYNANVENKLKSDSELVFKFREEDPNSPEENLVDPQENNFKY